MARRVLDIFLSSTARDLAPFREAVHERLSRTGLFHCIRQEDFGAQDAGAVEFCCRESQKADLFVGLVGLRRGWEPDGDNARRSITEMEHDWAREAGRRRYLWVAPDDFPVPGNLRESDEQHVRQAAFRGRVMGAGECIVSQKGFGSPELLASEIVEHLLAQLVTSDLITQLRPELASQESSSEEQAPAVAAAVERLASDEAIDLLALAKNPEGIDIVDLEAKLEARARQHEAEGNRERQASAEYWCHIGALASLHSPTKALAAYVKATALHPDNSDAWLWSGWLATETGDLLTAERAYQTVGRLKTGAPTDSAAYWARLGLGDIAVQRGNLPTAIEGYRNAQAEAERLAQADAGNAGWQRDLSVSHNKIGDVLVAQGKLAEALAAYQASLAIRERLAQADAGNSGWQRDLSVSQEKIGDVLVDQGKLAEALAAYQASLAIAERLAQADAGNAGWQRDLALSHGRVAIVLARQRATDDALRGFRLGRDIIVQLTRRSPDNATLPKDLAWFEVDIARLEG